jgi:hypothetical protein
MNTTTQTMQHPDRVTAFKWIVSGSAMAATVAIAIIALSIVGLAGVFSPTMAAIATIVAGAALLLEGGAFEATGTRLEEGACLAGGWSAEALGALAGIVLGILALLGVESITLLSVAVLTFGATLFLSGWMMSARGWVSGPMDGQLLLGLSITILGLLAVIGISSLTLLLVGLLIFGAAGLFGGFARGFKGLKESKYRAT